MSGDGAAWSDLVDGRDDRRRQQPRIAGRAHRDDAGVLKEVADRRVNLRADDAADLDRARVADDADDLRIRQPPAEPQRACRSRSARPETPTRASVSSTTITGCDLASSDVGEIAALEDRNPQAVEVPGVAA